MALVTTPMVSYDGNEIVISIRYDDVTEIIDQVIIENNSSTVTLYLTYTPNDKQPINQTYGPGQNRTINLNPQQQFTIYSKVDAVWVVV